MGKRFACDNGVLSGEFFARGAFKHMQDGTEDEKWKDIVRQGMSVLKHSDEKIQRFLSSLRRLKRQKTTDKYLRNIWMLLPRLGESLLGKIMRTYVQHEEPTFYGLLNAGTNVF